MADKEHTLQVETVAGNYTLYGRPCEISSFSFIPTERDEPAERTVFNSAKKVTRFDEGGKQVLGPHCCHWIQTVRLKKRKKRTVFTRLIELANYLLTHIFACFHPSE